ncbi:MAG: KpsF/GutQ family sugar-phosphate isomerase [Micavibrio sp.]|nr:KpsF/GutQ family sugar-phosphate isomerase [Micavibrio sp.]
MNSIDHAKKVLDTEIEGLTQLRDSIGHDFSRLIDDIHAMKDKKIGRLIVAGIGKSGHVGRKIAATLASTGTPAFYVHPGEASHGDMGMVTENDIVLMLSNSGENQELSDLIHYTRRYNIKMAAMTSNSDSTLAQHSDYILQLPKVPEACPNGMAPTTSTTMMMAYGDAIAVSLLHMMGLTKEQYKVFHPGGKLGQRLMTVAELMVGYDDLPLVGTEATMDAAILQLSAKNLGVVLVVSGQGALAGIITDGDLKRHMGADLLQKSVTEVMTNNPKSISTKALGVEAMGLMTLQSGSYLSSLVVLDNGELKGLIRLQDCLRAGLA